MPIATVGNSDSLNQHKTITNLLVAQANALGPASAITVTGGTMNGVIIGGATPAAGTFTNVTVTTLLDVSAGAVTFADGQINGSKLTDGTVAAAKLASNSITTAKITDLNVTEGKLADGAVTAVKLASDAVTTVKILDSNVTAAKLASDSVTTVKILDANVTTAKLADGAVTAVKLASDAVTTVKILDLNVTEGKLAAGAVTNTKIADNAVTLQKIQDNAVTTAKIADANVTTAKIADSNVTTAKIADGNVTAVKLATDSVETAKIKDNNITYAKFISTALASVAEMVTSTANKIITAANFFTYMDSYVERVVHVQTPTSATSFVINYQFRAGYSYEIEFNNIEFNVPNTTLQLDVSVDNGSNYISAGGSFQWRRWYGWTSTHIQADGNLSQPSIALTAFANLAGEELNGTLKLWNPTGASKKFSGTFTYETIDSSTSTFCNGINWFRSISNLAVDKVRITSGGAATFLAQGNVVVKETKCT